MGIRILPGALIPATTYNVFHSNEGPDGHILGHKRRGIMPGYRVLLRGPETVVRLDLYVDEALDSRELPSGLLPGGDKALRIGSSFFPVADVLAVVAHDDLEKAG